METGNVRLADGGIHRRYNLEYSTNFSSLFPGNKHPFGTSTEPNFDVPGPNRIRLRTKKGAIKSGRGYALALRCSISLTPPFVCVYRGRDGALRRHRRVQRRNVRTIDFTPSIPRLNGAGTAQRAVPTTRYFGYAKQVPPFTDVLTGSERIETLFQGFLATTQF
jgi:hypothetical protein